MIFHSKHAYDNGSESTVIITPDTDVTVICLAFSFKVEAKLFIETGTGATNRIISITMIRNNLQLRMPKNTNKSINHLCEAVLGMHSFTECDWISVFSGTGKVKAMKLLLKEDEYRKIPVISPGLIQFQRPVLPENNR